MSILFTIKAVMPLFLVVLAGVILRLLLAPSREQIMLVNRITFYLLLPCQLFLSAREISFAQITDPWPYVFAAVGCVVITFCMIWLTPLMIKGSAKQGAFVHSIIRPNVILLGLPLATALYGADSLPAQLMCVLILPLVNLLGVIALTRFSTGRSRITIRDIKPILTNPLIIALALGLITSALKIPIPDILASPIASLSTAASPLAMLNIGLSLSAAALNDHRLPVLLASAIRLLVLPAIMTGLAVLLGFRGILLFAVYLVFAVPTAANNGLICASMCADDDLANAATLVTTFASAVTLIAGIWLLQTLSLI